MLSPMRSNFFIIPVKNFSFFAVSYPVGGKNFLNQRPRVYATWKNLEMRKNLENGQNRVRISVNFDAKVSI